MIEYKGCVMCGREPIYIDDRTGEALCEACANINEGIYNSKGEKGDYRKV